MTERALYARPIPADPALGDDQTLPLAGGPVRFAFAQILSRSAPPRVVPARALPDDLLERLTAPRAPICGLTLDRPRIMGVINVTPDSFSDGGRHLAAEAAAEAGRRMLAEGADILDIGGESTRPGAAEIPAEEEAARVLPVITALRGAAPLSIDTRKPEVARAAFAAGAALYNDVSALTFAPDSLAAAAELGGPVCLMHAQGDPQTMQRNPRYDDVLLDVYDWLAARVAACEAAGIARARILVDPGIGFGKTLAHNLALLRGLSLFHGLGCAILLGVSRKSFIGALSGEADPARRAPGSIAAGLAGLAQGVQILRVHDVAQTAQAVAVWRAIRHGENP
ncbi:dihydropteroate synthase [Oceanicella actignis]|uniref:dihydropteroate synthase n=1 Tax=Oceanicella actignis TaxID=1189325 RepID=UPI0011E7D9BD|nr:dihydropteroate synthase [Oceanicella actignis]TYO90507.1 dihydropteroate synthase [Oceanicella actignis]